MPDSNFSKLRTNVLLGYYSSISSILVAYDEEIISKDKGFITQKVIPSTSAPANHPPDLTLTAGFPLKSTEPSRVDLDCASPPFIWTSPDPGLSSLCNFSASKLCKSNQLSQYIRNKMEEKIHIQI